MSLPTTYLHRFGNASAWGYACDGASCSGCFTLRMLHAPDASRSGWLLVSASGWTGQGACNARGAAPEAPLTR
jgi:hypothetical protein